MRKWKSKVLLAKLETTYGTDAAPTGPANAILAKRIELSPMEGEEVDRELELPTFGASEKIPVGLHARLSFSVDLIGAAAAGTAPAFGPLLRACGLAEVIVATTSVTYNPITTGIESASLYLWVDGTRYRLRGSQGTAEITLNAKGLPEIRFTFWGLWEQPTDVAQAVPALAAQIARKPKPGSTANTPAFTINGVSMGLQSFKFDLGVKVEPRMLIRREAIIITDREETVDMTVEAVALSVLNPYQLAEAVTQVPISLVHGLGAGNVVTLTAPTCQIKRPSGLSQSQDIVEWPLQAVPIPQAGNDQFTLAFT